MKDFFKMVLAVICGFIIIALIGFILSMGFIGSLAAASSSKPSLPKSGVLRIDLSKAAFGEQTQDANPFDLNPTSLLTGGSASSTKTIGIWDAAQALEAAAGDPAVKYIFIRTDGNVSSVTALEQLRTELAKFRSVSGKPVVAYMENPSTGSFYLASVCDKIYMTPSLGASSQFVGIGSQMIFLGDLLNRLGVNMQLIRHGKYKSAGEMYTRSEPSPENREQYQRLVDSMWETVGATIAQGRGLTIDALNTAIEELQLNMPQDFVDFGLVDELLDRKGLEDKLATLAVVDKYKDVRWMDFGDYVSAKQMPSKAKQKIAVIYAEGDIVDGNGKSEVAGDRFASLIAKVAADSTVKAVVLRVNSPGGSVLASDKIETELRRLQATKPVIASYGDYAASGGYWISNHCEKIYSAATTLTGSIGVFGIVPDLSKVTKDLAHVNIESVTSHKHGDMYGGMRPLDAAEMAYMQDNIEQVYDSFTALVSDGRGIPQETVDAIGQGRVWTGADALSINLVDEIGTLGDALRYAALKAGDPDLSQWNIRAYPTPPGTMDQLMEMLGRGSSDNTLAGSIKQVTTPRVLVRMDTDIRVR